MEDIKGELETSIQAKLESDTDFQASLVDLSDEDKTAKITEKTTELFNEELKALKEKATKADKAEEVAKNQKIRAEKAEKEAKQGKVNKETSPASDISPTDVIALIRSNVPEEDISEVQDYAKLKGISVSEALNSSVVKTILADKAETRRTANASNVSNVKRGVAKVSGETLLNKANKGEMPESDEDIIALVKARKGFK